MAKMKLLYAEGEVDVLTEQAGVFEKAGHEVERAVGRKGVIESLKKAKYDLVVLGPSLTRNDRHHLVYMVKKSNSATKVLVMHADGGHHPYVDLCTDTGASLESVVAKIAAMKPGAAGAAAGR
jgi:DNA-binding NtrC family response regulator